MQLDFTQGNFASYASDDGMRAKVVDTRTDKTVKAFKGETAWSDAQRLAGDKAVADMLNPSTSILRRF